MKTRTIILLIILFFGFSASASAFSYKAGAVDDKVGNVMGKLEKATGWFYSFLNAGMNGHVDYEGDTCAMDVSGNMKPYVEDIQVDSNIKEPAVEIVKDLKESEDGHYAMDDSEVFEKPDNDTGGTLDKGSDPVPEPATLLLLGLGLLGISGISKKKTKTQP